MTSKKDFNLISPALISEIDSSKVELFVQRINESMAPSVALKEFISLLGVEELDSSIIVDLLKRGYPGIDLSSFTYHIHDSNYPFGDPLDLTDEDFNKRVLELNSKKDEPTCRHENYTDRL